MTHRFTRLQLATRIHFGLLRETGEGVDVGRMLRQRDYAGTVLKRCRSLASFALLDLADRFDDLGAAEDARMHLARAAARARTALAELSRRAADEPLPSALDGGAWSGAALLPVALREGAPAPGSRNLPLPH